MIIGVDARSIASEVPEIAWYARSMVEQLSKAQWGKDEQCICFVPEGAKDLPASGESYVIVPTKILGHSLADQWRFNQLLKKNRFDEAHFLTPNHPSMYTGRTIFSLHDAEWPHPILLRRALRRCQLVAVSHTLKRQVLDTYRLDADRIQVIYPGISLNPTNTIDPFDRLRVNHEHGRMIDIQAQNGHNDQLSSDSSVSDAPLKRPYLLYVGAIAPGRNIIRLLEAFASLHARNRTMQLVLAGPGKSTFLEPAIEHLRLNGAVVMRPDMTLHQAETLYADALATVVPYTAHGFTPVPLQSFVAHVPVIGSSNGVLPELASDGGLYFNPKDPLDMADKIGSVLRKSTVRSLLVKAGSEQVKQFSWDASINQLQSLYRRSILPTA